MLNLNRTENPIDFTQRGRINDNWDKIEVEFNTSVQKTIESALEQVVDSAKLIWKTPVVNFSDLAITYPNPEVGWTAQTTSTGNVYRYNEDGVWEYIQQVAAGPINEVNDRLLEYIERIAVTPEQFGAVGDGVADDTQAIQDAINNGYEVIFNQRYEVTSEINVTGPRRLIGNNSEISNKTSNSRIFHITSSGVTIDGLRFSGLNNGSYNINSRFIECSGTSNVVNTSPIYIENIHILNCNFFGGSGWAVLANYVMNINVLDCTINKIGYTGLGFNSCKNVRANRNVITDINPGSPVGLGVNAYAIYFSQLNGADTVRYPFSENCEANNNVIDNVPWEGLDTHGGINIRFISNKISNTPVGVAIIKSDNELSQTIGDAKDVTIRDNVFEKCPAAIALSDVAIDNYHENIIISGNKVFDCGSDSAGPIVLGYVKGVSITDNQLYRCRGNGVLMRGRVYGFNVSNNSFVNMYTTVNNSTAFSRCVFVGANYATGVIQGNTLERDESFTTFGKINEIGAAISNSATDIDVNIGINNFNAATFQKHALSAARAKLITPPIRFQDQITFSPTTTVNSITQSVTLPTSYSGNTLYETFGSIYSVSGANTPVFVLVARVNTSTINVTIRTINGENFATTGAITVTWMTSGF